MTKGFAAAALAALWGCAGARPGPEAQGLARFREEARVARRAGLLNGWLEGTTGKRPIADARPAGEERLLGRPLREALQSAGKVQGLAPDEKLALRFLADSLLTRAVARATAPFDAELSTTELLATLSVPTFDTPVAYRNLPLSLAAEPDANRRAGLASAEAALLDALINPILERKEAAAQRAAQRLGFADPVALAEELRGVRLSDLLAQGAAYVAATDTLFLATLDRVAREELGIGREALRLSDLPRLWKAPSLGRFFPLEGELPALRDFLAGLGLDLRTAAGTTVQIDDALRPGKRPRAFVAAVDAPADVRLSVKPTGGLDDYWTLFHEAGHAVHFASSTVRAHELVDLGHAAPSEAFGELFRHAFADPHFLIGYRERLRSQGQPAPTNAALASVVRRTALVEMMLVRRYAFSKLAYELALHGRPRSELAPALALLAPAERALSEGSLRELYRQLFARGSGIALSDQDAARFRADVDDNFASADYARCFALSAMLDEGLRAHFGAGWTSEPAAGAFLKTQLFAKGRALSAEQVAERLGFAPRLDFALAARRAARLLREADLLEHGS